MPPPAPVGAKPNVRKTLKLGIDHAGLITVEGRPVPPDNSLEEWLRILREREGCTDLTIVVGLGVPGELITKVAHVAARAGFEGFTQVRAPAGETTRVELKEDTRKDRSTQDHEPRP